MKKKLLKGLFYRSGRTNQWYMNYKGMHIYIDNDEFEKASEEDIENIIKSKTTQHPKPKPQEDILSHDEGL